jgi:Putative adhesin/zinc-ribbon domain
MPEPCQNCGAELYGGQQFCRRCGAPVSAASPPGEAPTQLFPEGAQTFAAPPPAGTFPLGGGRTDAVSRQQPTAYQPPLAAYQQTSPLPAAPPPARRRRRGAWLAVLLVVFVLGAGLASGAAYVWWRATRQPVVRRMSPGVPPVPAAPAAPGVPADLGDRIKEALKGAGVPLPLDESGAVVSGATTVLTRTYELGDEAAFAVHAVKGSVTVTGADGEAVVVKITKHGGSAAERGGARVLESKTDEGVTLLTAPGQADAVSVSYEISVPRGLRQLEVAADRGDVRVSGLAGAVVSEVGTGEVEFRDVSGEVRSKLIKGSTRVLLGGAEREGSQQFSVVRGDIEATFADGASADLKAETLDGDIEVDAVFGLRVEKAPAGRRLAGRLGEGGEALYFKVTNGDVRLKK